MSVDSRGPSGMQRQRAFTLIEVLVVVAIIALLIAILIPSLARAREQAQGTVCKSNVHQMAVAMSIYTVDHKAYPGHHLTPGLAPAGVTGYRQWEVLWPVRLLRYTQKQNQAFWCPSAPKETYWNGKDHLLPYITYVTRSDEMGTFSYGYNDWGAVVNVRAPHRGLGGHINDKVHGEPKVDKIKLPAEMLAIADNDVTKENLFSQVYGTWDTAIDPSNSNEYPGARHNKGANFAFCDGHAEWISQKKAVEKKKKMRARWNNDFKNHCSEWSDKESSMPCLPTE